MDGLLLINKPTGITSHDVVDRVRRILKLKEVGHSGTLDPMASGLMVLLLGRATKLSPFILEQDKSYELRFRLGMETDSLDATGNITKTVDLSEWASRFGKSKAECDQSLLKECELLMGEQELEVPRFSAIKEKGEKLYEKARRGEDFQPPKKRMCFYDLEYQSIDFFGESCLRLRCSKGSFIRSWVKVLGERLGTLATLTGLERTASYPYRLEKAMDLGALADFAKSGALLGSAEDLTDGIKDLENLTSFVPIRDALPHFKWIRASDFSEHLLKNGLISHDLKRQLIASFDPEMDQGVRVLSRQKNELVGLITLDKEKGFVLRRVFKES